MINYYSLRRVTPYLGVIQVIDTGAVRAYSSRGERWQPRRVYDSQQFWSTTEASHNCGFEVLPKELLLHAIVDRPPMPFPQEDCYELWLLHRETRMPLALLKTCRWERDMDGEVDPNWRPFLPGRARFQTAHCRTATGKVMDAQSCQGEAERLINFAAKPRPSAQWFQRHDDGSGQGLNGLRVDAALAGRYLPRQAFPQLLVDELNWQNPGQQALLCSFHDFFAAPLLVHQGISNEIRARLEGAVQLAPAGLVDTYSMIPEMLDTDGLAVAMVTARLMQGNGAANVAEK